MSNSYKKIVVSLLLLCAPVANAADTKPKYGPEATRITLEHQYFRNHEAPDYWVISPYYVPQQDGRSCSLASVTMIVNAARAFQNLTADDELAVQSEVLKKTNNTDWQRDLGPVGKGVTLDELGRFTEAALRAYGITPTEIDTIHADNSKEFHQKLHQLLIRNEKSNRNFIIANFLQGVYTGDASVGHIAPVGAYDAQRHRVLIMDPDRVWYEPYWVSEETFLKGMNTQDDTTKKTRGLVWIQLPEGSANAKTSSISSSD
jgi:hypothetical protein